MYKKLSNITCIYILTNNINNKSYVGQTIELRKRIRTHFSEAYNPNALNRSTCRALHSAIRKYGKEVFNLKIIECDREELDKLEVEQISLNATMFPTGYNLLTGGGANRHMSDASKQKISISKTGSKMSEETKAKMRISNKGKRLNSKHTEEAKMKMSEYHKTLVGERNNSAKLKESQVIEIYTDRTLSSLKASRFYGVSHTTIKRIRNNKSWCHVTSRLSTNII